MINKNVKFLICDHCGEMIEDASDGWLEWLSPWPEDGGRKCKGLRIVHKVKCVYGHTLYKNDNAYHIMDVELRSRVDVDGFMRFLEMISDDRFDDVEEVLEVIKRLFIPGYEEARGHFSDAIYEGYFEPNTKPMYYWQKDIIATLEYIKTLE